MSLATAATYVTHNWPLDEAAATDALGALGGLDLAQSGTVAFGRTEAGGLTRSGFSSSNYFSHADAAPFDVGTDDWFLVVHADLDSLSTYSAVVDKDVGATGNAGSEIFLWYIVDNNTFYSGLKQADGTLVQISCTAVPVSAGTAYQLVMQHDHTAGLARLAVNGVEATPAAIAGGVPSRGQAAYVGVASNHTEPTLGALWDLTVGRGYVLTAADLTEAWNGGTPKRFAQWATPATATRDQGHFRWRNDDGSQAAATWAAAEDTALTLARYVPRRLRVQAAVTGDPPAEAVKLQYRPAGGTAADWRDVRLP